MFMYVHPMNQSTTAPKGLSVRQAAELVGRDATDIRDAIANGELAFRQVITLDRSDVEAWAKRGES